MSNDEIEFQPEASGLVIRLHWGYAASVLCAFHAAVISGMVWYAETRFVSRADLEARDQRIVELEKGRVLSVQKVDDLSSRMVDLRTDIRRVEDKIDLVVDKLSHRP